MLRLRSDDDDEMVRGFLSKDLRSELVCFLFDVVLDDLAMMIDVVSELIIFVVLINYERLKKCNEASERYVEKDAQLHFTRLYGNLTWELVQNYFR